MSVKQMALVWDLDLPSTEKLVLLKLADCADDRGRNSFPSVDRIGAECGLARRSVQRMLSKLRDLQLIEVEQGALFDRPTTYRIRPDRGAKLAPLDIGGAIDADGGRQIEHEGAPHDRPIRHDPSVQDPSVVPNKAEAAKTAGLTPEWLREAWNARRGTLPECRELSPVLRQNARMRLKELREPEAWVEIIATIAASAFCNGQNDRGWRSDFGHLVQRGTWEKARAGRYAARPTTPARGGDMRRQVRDANVKQVASQGFYKPNLDDIPDDDEPPREASGATH